MARGRRHVHKYEKVNIGRKQDYFVYMCRLTDCTHRQIPEAMLGKSCVCWGCGKEFVITVKHLDVVKLKCDSCRGMEVVLTAEPVAPTPSSVPSGKGSLDVLLDKLGMGKKE